MDSWTQNVFWADVVSRLTDAEATTWFGPQSYDDGAGAWAQTCQPAAAAAPVLLQGRRLVVDVTDRGLALYPLGLTGRFHLDVDFTVGDEHTSPLAAPDAMRRLLTRPGQAVLEGAKWRVATAVSPTLPLVVMTVEQADAGVVAATVRWVAGSVEDGFDGGVWLRPARFAQDAVIERNNSTAPDPLPLRGLPDAGVGVVLVGSNRPAHHDVEGTAVLLTTEVYGTGTVRSSTMVADGADVTTLLIGVTADQEAFHTAVAAWRTNPTAHTGYWDRLADRLSIDVPDRQLTRQLRYSVHNSLFSRAVGDGGREIFVHGRRDRGYADASHLHQSYQMHLPALAAGEGASVRDELLAYAALQRPDGWLQAAPRPGKGSSRYVGRYTNAHLLLAVHRYLTWTGDWNLLDEPSTSTFDPVARSFGERVRRAADDLLGNRVGGLVAPCGWADAWNPAVRAQGQISAAALRALDAYGEVLTAAGQHQDGAAYRSAAHHVRTAMCNRLLDRGTGLVAEHVFDTGVEGGTIDDFWAHTQIWAALAGVVTDGRGLDLVEQHCLDRGLCVAPESAFDRAYIADSTDDAQSLPLASTATWLLARWPELTHLYALARIETGKADAALAAVHSQLPERLHRDSPVCAPYYYAEKYLYPGTRPWLCTWAGDPSLIEVVLTGFLGVQPAIDGTLWLRPCLPTAWSARPLTARFQWRGADYRLELDPAHRPGVLTVDGVARPATAPIPASGANTASHVLQMSS